MSYHLISWGANSHGQLGQGMLSEECVLPHEVGLSSCSLNPRKIRKIVGGAGHTLILDDDGRVYSCGWNNKGQAGFSKSEHVLTFREVGGKLGNKAIADIACGWDCSAALTTEGTLFLWGSNSYGQLGKHPTALRWAGEPFEVALGRKIKRVSIGLRHTALITEARKVLVAGAGNKGQLGLSPSEDKESFEPVYSFTEVPTLKNIASVSCGQHHTIAVTVNGSLYAFGDNKHGQLGLDTDLVSKSSFPIRVTDRFDSSVQTRSGWSHVIALSEGQIHSWGRNTYGQLGCAEFDGSSSWRTMRVEGISKVLQVSVGSEHNVVLTEEGRIFCWGWNEHGNCGNGHNRDVRLPEKLLLPFEAVPTHIGSGAGHSFAVIRRS